MLNKKRISRTAPVAAFVQERFIPDEGFGVCGNCPRYRSFKPHEVWGDAVRVSCAGAKGMVSAKIELTTHEECEHYQK
ncbi:MAG: hypothetical protein RL097_627 [Candidatus Parcubacteria bacterium]|jgi:hypothetical protein